MFSISEFYRDAIQKSKPSYLTGTITFANGSVREIGDRDVPSDGCSITMQAVTNDVLEFGAAVLGQLDLVVRTPRSESRYNYYGASIHLDFNIETENGLETIPMGDWNVVEADRDRDTLKLSAYDNLFKFDQPFILTLRGAPYDLMLKLAEDCGCELAEDLKYYESLPNGIHHLSLDANVSCGTYRQAASVIAQMCGCFVQADRYGRISLKQFSTVETFSLTPSQRYSSVISDFVCQYVDIVVTSLSGTFSAVSTTVERGISMYLDKAPAWDDDSEDAAQVKTDGLLSYLETIHYTPCELSVFSDPSIDCGDRITLYTDEGVYETIVTRYTWTFHNRMEITSVGQNPYLLDSTAATQQAIRDLEKNGSSGSLTVLHNTTNVDAFNCTSTLLPIATIAFVATADTFVIFHATIQFDVVVDDITSVTYLELLNADGTTTKHEIPYSRDGQVEVSIRYLFNNVWTGPEYTATFNSGSHIITLYYPITAVAKQSDNRFVLYLSANGGQVVIGKGKFVGTISGQGLAQTIPWDGTLEFTEEIDKFGIVTHTPKFGAVAETIEFAHIDRNDSEEISDVVAIKIPQTRMGLNLSEVMEVSAVVKHYEVRTFDEAQYDFDRSLVWHSGYFALRTEHQFESVEAPIDSGRMAVLKIKTDDKTTIEGLVIEQ